MIRSAGSAGRTSAARISGRRGTGSQRRHKPRGFSFGRMFRLRHLERGQTSLEYLGMVAVVVAIIGGLVGTAIGTEVGRKLTGEVCKVVGASCGDQSGDGGQPQAGDEGDNGTGEGEQADDDGQTPQEKEYEDAKEKVEELEEALEDSKEQAKEAAEAFAKILADELGITDAFECLTEGDGSACTETAINIALSLLGGLAAKILKKYGPPWKWDDAYKVIKELKQHGGDAIDGIKDIIKHSKALKKARERLKKAKNACDHSFLPGTPVLLANGSRIAIEDVRRGDRVRVTDPKRGLTTARPVAGTITTQRDKDFTRLTVRSGGLTSTVTATDTHPFWLTDQRRWVDAGDIEPGAMLRTPSGDSLPVVRVSDYERRQTTHDLSVRGIHTYYIGTGVADALVHNCPTKKPKPPVPTGLKNASDGMKSIYADGSLKGQSITNIRDKLLKGGFTRKLAKNKKGYLYTNAEGEQVRIMRRNGGWDMRVRNKHGNYLDANGNVADPNDTHGIEVKSK